MNKLMTRAALAAATVTMTGSALLAVTGTASAATQPTAQHNPTTAVVTVPASTPAQGHATASVVSVAQHGSLSRIGQGWSLSEGQREWHGERDASGYAYWASDDNGHQLRYDGHRVYHRHHGQWTAITQADERAYAFDRWHFDQLWTIQVLEDPYSI